MISRLRCVTCLVVFNVVAAMAAALEATTQVLRDTLFADEATLWGLYAVVVALANAVLRVLAQPLAQSEPAREAERAP